MSYLLDWFNILSGFESAKTIQIPNNYRKKVLVAKSVFDNDVTGIATTLSDFMIKNAIVDYKIETSNEPLNDILNDWIININSEYSTYIPSGIKSLAKQYFTERWKGSSNILLRCAWGKQDGFQLPTQMVFVAGEDIIAERPKDGVIKLDNIKYFLRISKKNKKRLPVEANETIYVRKPFESWDVTEPTPFIIKRGIYYNFEFMKMILEKTSFIVSKAMKYLFHIIQGSENMEIKSIDTYSSEDLEATKDKLKEVEARSNTESGVPVFATNWDTTIKHMIPDYEQVLKQDLFTAVTQRLLNGFGILEMEKSTRKEDTLNPKPMISEIENGIADFVSLLEDVLRDVKKRNQKAHPKYFRNLEINIWTPAVLKSFLTQELLTHIRSAYDRGDISKETYSSIFGMKWNVEVSRRIKEITSSVEDLMQPHAVQVQDSVEENTPSDTETTTDDKKGPEKKNFEQNRKLQISAAKKLKNYNEAPYKTIKDLPATVKVLPSVAKKMWLDVFNKEYKESKDEDTARKVAWDKAKESYIMDKDSNWVKKNK